MVDGKPSKNPRYLQRRPDRVDQRGTYLAEIRTRLDREIAGTEPLLAVVGAVLAGRRANLGQSEIGLPPLAVFNPIHYQELPELFMDFLSSLTGKSPSTTGFGSEGALTKGPFNALWPVVDMNNALVSAILTGYGGFTSAAGYVGPKYRVDHDVSMIVPELWCRMSVREREPAYLIEHGYLEKVADFELAGRKVLASRLGYRITRRFVEHFLARMFQAPNAVFPEDDAAAGAAGRAAFAAGIDAIVETQTRVASELLRGRQRRRRVPAPEGAAAHHGVRPLRRHGHRPAGDPRAVQQRSAAEKPVVPRASRHQADQGHRALATPPSSAPRARDLRHQWPEHFRAGAGCRPRARAGQRGELPRRVGGHARRRSVSRSIPRRCAEDGPARRASRALGCALEASWLSFFASGRSCSCSGRGVRLFDRAGPRARLLARRRGGVVCRPVFGLVAARHRAAGLRAQLGLVLFVYTLGLASGPGFFASLRLRGVRDNALALGVLSVCALAAHGLARPRSERRRGSRHVRRFAHQHARARWRGGKASSRGASGEALSAPVIACSICYPLGVFIPLLVAATCDRWFHVTYAKEKSRAPTAARATRPSSA